MIGSTVWMPSVTRVHMPGFSQSGSGPMLSVSRRGTACEPSSSSRPSTVDSVPIGAAPAFAGWDSHTSTVVATATLVMRCRPDGVGLTGVLMA